MFQPHVQVAPARATALRTAAEAAARTIAPAFPLDSTVAVNPFLDQIEEGLATASARLARIAGIRLALPRQQHAAALKSGAITDEDLAAALADCASPLKPACLAALKKTLSEERPAPAALPTVAVLAARASGTDWPLVLSRSIGLWAAGHFDRGQALWTPAPGRSAFEAWREWATHDLAPEIAGLKGFCAHVAKAPDTAERALLRACETLALSTQAAPTFFHQLLIEMGGWAQHARWLLWQAEQRGETDTTLIDLLALRLLWEEALFQQFPAIGPAWSATVEAHAVPVSADADDIADDILQAAAERAWQRQLAAKLARPARRDKRPALQAAFCIDVRSEIFRRALEATDPGVMTLGFAGFFGLPVAHRPYGSVESNPHLPVLLSPSLTSCCHGSAQAEEKARISARAIRAWSRFRQAAVSSFAFVEAAGLSYGRKLLLDSLGLTPHRKESTPVPRFDPALPAEAKAGMAAKILRAMSLAEGHARLVLLVGHGADLTNNPHKSAYQCGACGGQSGEVSARLLASLLNDPQVRAALPALDISVPADTLFVAALHDTTSDEVILYNDQPAPDHEADLRQAGCWLEQAGRAARAQRAEKLPGARAQTLEKRARDWAEVRPEWGLAGCAAFIAAPRDVTASADLEGRTFLHSYDWSRDSGFGTLGLILTAPVVVASWISLQYFASSVAPDVYGSGNKLIHNVVGGFGVMEGNGGLLRTGLPRQAVHDGLRLAHQPLRLSVFIEAPEYAITEVLERNPQVRMLFDSGWLHLFALTQGRVSHRYRPGLKWDKPWSHETVNEAA